MLTQRKYHILLECLLGLACLFLLYRGVVTTGNDTSHYKCEAYSFWAIADTRCNVSPFVRPFHILPPEYPILSLVAFSYPLLIPSQYYSFAFSYEILLAVMVTFFFLRKVKSPHHAWIFVLYIVAGSFGLALTRFDLLPALLLVFALHCAKKKKFFWAYIFLAAATLLKIYPIVLLPPLFFYEQSVTPTVSRFRLQYKGILIFIGICAAVTLFSFALNPAGTLRPLSFFQTRPFEIESMPASIIWLLSRFGLSSYCIGFQFNSLNLYIGSQFHCIQVLTPVKELPASIFPYSPFIFFSIDLLDLLQ